MVHTEQDRRENKISVENIVKSVIKRPVKGSAVIEMVCYEEKPVQVHNEKLLFQIIRAAFNQRRKTLINSLKNSQQLSFGKEQIEGALRKMDLPFTVRGEALRLEEFAELSDILENQ